MHSSCHKSNMHSGTTYSGLTWAQTLRPELQVPIIQWPDATSGSLENITDDKVPTEIRYDGQDFIWGFQIPEYGQRHQWFKLNLDHTQSSLLRGVATGYIDLMAAPRSYDKTVDNFSTNYLTALRRHTKLVMRNKLPSSAVISTPVEHVVCFTKVPYAATRERATDCLARSPCRLCGRMPPNRRPANLLSRSGYARDLLFTKSLRPKQLPHIHWTQ